MLPKDAVLAAMRMMALTGQVTPEEHMSSVLARCDDAWRLSIQAGVDELIQLAQREMGCSSQRHPPGDCLLWRSALPGGVYQSPFAALRIEALHLSEISLKQGRLSRSIQLWHMVPCVGLLPSVLSISWKEFSILRACGKVRGRQRRCTARENC